MTNTLITAGDFRIDFNGSATYMIVDNNGDCWDCVDTLRKAKNRLNKILKNYNLSL
jgi:2-iminoacetate synthase ThiH|tara:strand:+ start:34 stop:201 length:168 start_codon:yes stop_codon:yes gene_type:complete